MEMTYQKIVKDKAVWILMYVNIFYNHNSIKPYFPYTYEENYYCNFVLTTYFPIETLSTTDSNI